MVELLKTILKLNKTLPTDEELLREAIMKIRRKDYDQLTHFEHTAVMYGIERIIAEYTIKRYAIPNAETEVSITIK